MSSLLFFWDSKHMYIFRLYKLFILIAIFLVGFLLHVSVWYSLLISFTYYFFISPVFYLLSISFTELGFILLLIFSRIDTWFFIWVQFPFWNVPSSLIFYHINHSILSCVVNNTNILVIYGSFSIAPFWSLFWSHF